MPKNIMKEVKQKSLEELENDSWGSSDNDSNLVATCHRLRKVPIGEFSVEDLRIMIGQSIGVQYLLPLALEVLNENPLSEGDFYPGDLLSSVVRLNKEIWRQHPEWLEELSLIVKSIKNIPEEIEKELHEFTGKKA